MLASHVMLVWLNERLQNGGFSLAPRVLLSGGWVAAHQVAQND